MEDPTAATLDSTSEELKIEQDLSNALDTPLAIPPVDEEAAAIIEAKEEREGSSSSSTKSHKRKRSMSNNSNSEPVSKAPRRTKRVVAPPPPLPANSRERSKSGGSTRRPAAPKRPPARKGSRLIEEVFEDDPSEEYEGKTRCVCGMDDDDALGFMIMCETCKCWQHGQCVGFATEAQCPEIYFCELCRPDLHVDLLAHLSPRPTHARRPSRTREPVETAVVATALTQEEPAEMDGEEEDDDDDDDEQPAQPSSPGMPMYPATSHFAEPKNPGRRRSTMNSRDAAYEESLAAALALSQAEAEGVPRSRSSQALARKSRSATQEDGDDYEVQMPKPRRRPAAANKRKRSTQDTVPEQASKRTNGKAPVEADSRSVSPQDSDRAVAVRPQRNQKRGSTKPPVKETEDSDEATQSGSAPPPIRAKHPNQYTYRPKENGEVPVRPPKKASPSKRKQVAIREASARIESDAEASGATLSVPNGRPKAKRKSKASSAAEAAAAAVAEAVAKDELDRRNGGQSSVTSSPQTSRRNQDNPWHLPAHLEHLAATLGPAPGKTLSTKPKYPTKRATVGDMKKRAKTMLDYLAKSQILLGIAPSPSGSESGSSNGAGAPVLGPHATTSELIADLEADVKAFGEKYAQVPSVPVRSSLSQQVATAL